MRAWELRRAAAAFFMPNRCPFCDELIGMRGMWCERCFNRLRLYEGGDSPAALDGFSAACLYTGRARTAVLRLKKGYYRYPADAFAVIIAENARELIANADIITSVPSSRRRRKELGYAQSELIAKLVAEIARKPYRRLLKAAPHRQEQKRLSAEERWKNAQGSFKALPKCSIAAGKNVLIIDDVCTTGATLSAAASIIRKSGAESVSGAVFAKTLKPTNSTAPFLNIRPAQADTIN